MRSAAPDQATARVEAFERLAVAAVSALYLYLVTHRQGAFIYLLHKASTGAWVDEAARVLDGELMYRDFSEAIAPGVVYLNALALGTLGRNLGALAALGILIGCGLALALHDLSARLAPRPWRLIPPALFVGLAYPANDFGGHRWPALLLGLLGLGVLVRGRSAPRAAAAGLLFGLASLFTPAAGLGIAAGAAAALLCAPRSSRAAAALLAGLLAPILLAGGWFAAQAGGRVVADVALRGVWTDLDEPGLRLLGSWGGRSAASLVASATAVFAGIVSFRRAGGARRLCAAAGFGLLATVALGTVDAHSLLVHSAVLSVCLAAELPLWSDGAARVSRSLVVAVLALGLLHGAVGLVVWRQWIQPMVRQRFRAGETWLGAPNAELEWIASQARPADAVFVFPAGGGSYFLTATRNATSFPYVVEGRFGADRQRQALAELDAARPAVGLWRSEQPIATFGAAEDLGTLYDGILARYDVAASLPSGALLLVRKAPGSEAR
jgi:hypothetical protein